MPPAIGIERSDVASEGDYYEAIRKVKAKIATSNDWFLVQTAAKLMGPMSDAAREALNAR